MKTAHKQTGRPLILTTNDDGVDAKGLKILARTLKGLGQVVVVAPGHERSAASHSITLHRPLRINHAALHVYAVDGTPTDCVMLGIHEILGRKPDIIVSGINKGANLGDDVHYSGTVSAAFEGGILGVPSIAVSLLSDGEENFETAAVFTMRLVRKVLKDGLPPGIILNVNVPDCSADRVKGFVFVKQGKRDYGNIIEERLDPRGRKYYWIAGDETGFEDIKESDCNAVRAGFISITPLRVNLTDWKAMKSLSKWRL